ncbi:hypothetical protein Tco_1051011 [Tanacetum coccineum]
MRTTSRQEALDFKTLDAAPQCKTMLGIERHAARVYTRTIFMLVQKEIIEGCWSCTIQDLKINKGFEIVMVRDKAATAYGTLNTKTGKKQDMESLRVAKLVKIIRDVIPKSMHSLSGSKILLHESHVISMNLSKDEVKLTTFLEKLKLIKDEVKVDVSNPPSRNTGDVIGGIFSISKPKQVDVQNPTKSRNKRDFERKGT